MGSVRRRCDIRTRRTYWKPAPTCAPSNCCSGTSSSNTLSSICTCRVGICTRSPTRWMRCRFPHRTRCAGPVDCSLCSVWAKSRGLPRRTHERIRPAGRPTLRARHQPVWCKRRKAADMSRPESSGYRARNSAASGCASIIQPNCASTCSVRIRWITQAGRDRARRSQHRQFPRAAIQPEFPAFGLNA